MTGNVALAVDFAPTNGLMARIDAGETADVAILTREGVDAAGGRGVLVAATAWSMWRGRMSGSRCRRARARPDIGSPEALKAALLAARSIAYSRIGASGILFAGLIRQLGIADEVNAKATIIPSGFTGELAARGEVELAVQQVSELMVVPGVDVVGPLPPAAESVTMFSAGVFATSVQAEAALELIAYLRSSRAAQALSAAGLQPAA